MNIGIISFAHMHANSYARAIQSIENVHLAGIADDDEGRGRSAAERFNTTYYSSYEELLNQNIDAVIVASENVNHREHVLAAANAKKHILCEKPLATTIEDGQAMIKGCADNDVKLQIAHPVRFNTSIARAKQIIDNGKIGKVIAIKGTNRGRLPGGWFVDPLKSGGGAIMDHTVHVVDIMRWFLNSEVKEVYAESGQLFTSTPIDDAGIVSIEFTNDVFATIDCSWSRSQSFPKGVDITLEIIGTEGILSIDAFEQNISIYSNKHGVKKSFWGDNMDLALVQDFVQNVMQDKEPSTTGNDGLKTIEVAIAAYQSTERLQTVRLR